MLKKERKKERKQLILQIKKHDIISWSLGFIICKSQYDFRGIILINHDYITKCYSVLFCMGCANWIVNLKYSCFEQVEGC